MASRIAVNDAEDLQNFIQMGLIPSTPQLVITLGVIGAVSLLLAVYLYKKRSEWNGDNDKNRVYKTEKILHYLDWYIPHAAYRFADPVYDNAEDGMVWDYQFFLSR